ncbi:MAG: site-specific integrase, partial [Dehalococcoidia bacterium]|nr:site-specific integrase [Dehalococcoidia bacterium]
MRRAPKGAGSVYHRRDGRWVAVLPLAGGRKKALYGKTQAQARDKLIKAQRDLQLGQEPQDERLTVGAYLTRWVENTCRPKLRPSTFRAYSDIVKLHILPVVGRNPINRLTRDHVQGMLRKATEAGKAPRTVRNIRAVLRHALNQAIADGLLSRNVAAMAAVPRLPRSEGKMLSPEDARKLLEVAQGSRWAACYEVMLTLGLRRG